MAQQCSFQNVWKILILTVFWFFTKSYLLLQLNFEWKRRWISLKTQRLGIVNKWHVFWRYWKVTKLNNNWSGISLKIKNLIFNFQPLWVLSWGDIVSLLYRARSYNFHYYKWHDSGGAGNTNDTRVYDTFRCVLIGVD